jgi:predicted glycogen debranching enzyme
MIRRVPPPVSDPAEALAREWLVTNGLGGYASGSVLGPPTRRYHGYLIAALRAPYGRMVVWDGLSEIIEREDRSTFDLTGASTCSGLVPPTAPADFAMEMGLPIWRFGLGDSVLEKRVLMPHLQNTTIVTYGLAGGERPVTLRLRVWLAFRGHEQPLEQGLEAPLTLNRVSEHRYEAPSPHDLPPLRLLMRGAPASFLADPPTVTDLCYPIEEERGQPYVGVRQSPGSFQVTLRPGEWLALTGSTEAWATLDALTPEAALGAEMARRVRLIAAADEAARQGTAAELVLAADQFVFIPVTRIEDATRAHATGEELRSVIAGYHWFTDWGRDTMISLEGLALVTGRHREAGDILLSFAHHIRDGLIPNLFPEGQEEGLYHTADATLWFFHAVDRYREWTGDMATFNVLLPTLASIVEHHVAGTHFGIGVDPADGLLRQGTPGYQLTWMDAKVDGWVVTPRRGKAVEINALWYNALRLLEGWQREAGASAEADRLGGLADRTYRSFNERFWNEPTGCLFDVVDGEEGDDPSCRPNQIIAFALRHPVLAPERRSAVLEVVRSRLLTPVGLRSLAPGERDYKPRYYGDLRSRDAAYHQGTVWTWLIGPYCDALRTCRPDDREAMHRILDGLLPTLDQAGIGTISEIFDAEPPFAPRGCIAQAWSVAEALRLFCETARREQLSSTNPLPPTEGGRAAAE